MSSQLGFNNFKIPSNNANAPTTSPKTIPNKPATSPSVKPLSENAVIKSAMLPITSAKPPKIAIAIAAEPHLSRNLPNPSETVVRGFPNPVNHLKSHLTARNPNKAITTITTTAPNSPNTSIKG